MFVGLLPEQCSRRLQRVDDCGVGILQHVEPGESSCFFCEGACFVDRAQNGQPVFLAGVEVIDTMARSGVHQTSA